MAVLQRLREGRVRPTPSTNSEPWFVRNGTSHHGTQPVVHHLSTTMLELTFRLWHRRYSGLASERKQGETVCCSRQGSTSVT